MKKAFCFIVCVILASLFCVSCTSENSGSPAEREYLCMAKEYDIDFDLSAFEQSITAAGYTVADRTEGFAAFYEGKTGAPDKTMYCKTEDKTGFRLSVFADAEIAKALYANSLNRNADDLNAACSIYTPD